jgi:ribosomal protein S18 acetylase RimI-like enzyme
MRIREATPADLDPIPSPIMDLIGRAVPLMRASGNYQWSDDYPNREVFRRDLELHQLWCAEVDACAAKSDGCIAAVAAITLDQSPEYADAGWDLREQAIVVHRLAVDPARRGLGLAHALMRHAEFIARERGIQLLRVDTNSVNKAMQQLFVKLGYTFAGEISLAGRKGLRFFCYGKSL